MARAQLKPASVHQGAFRVLPQPDQRRVRPTIYCPPNSSARSPFPPAILPSPHRFGVPHLCGPAVSTHPCSAILCVAPCPRCISAAKRRHLVPSLRSAFAISAFQHFSISAFSIVPPQIHHNFITISYQFLYSQLSVFSILPILQPSIAPALHPPHHSP
jgi:hypothetical protein